MGFGVGWSWSLKDKTPTPELMFWRKSEFIPELEFSKHPELEVGFLYRV
jgi:hypothetical protein